MKKPLLFFLAFISVAAFSMAWYFHGEGVRLRLVLDRLKADQEWSADRSETGGKRARQNVVAPLTAAARNRLSQESKQHYDQLWQDPRFVRLMLLRLRLPLDRQYGSLFKRLKLPPAQLEILKDLLVEKQIAAADARRIAREHGGLASSEVAALSMQATQDLETAISATLGAEKFRQYQDYEKTWPLRSRLQDLADRLDYLDQSLDVSQTEQILNALADAIPISNDAQIYPAIVAFPRGAVTQIKQVLTPAQFETFLRFQEEKQADQEISPMDPSTSNAQFDRPQSIEPVGTKG